MTNKIQIFENQEFGAIRTLSNEHGETFFCGKDVAMALGYTNPMKAIRIHVDSEDKGVNKMGTPVCPLHPTSLAWLSTASASPWPSGGKTRRPYRASATATIAR